MVRIGGTTIPDLGRIAETCYQRRMAVSLQAFLAFCRQHAGESLATIGEQAEFHVTTVGNTVTIVPASGKTRTLTETNIASYLERFNATESFVTTDYTDDFRNASYVLGIIRRLAPPASKRPFRSDASYEAEHKTRDMLVSFLAARGLTRIDDARQVTGTAVAQKISAMSPTGRKLVMAVKICWHKNSANDAIVHSAAQLLARVDKRDWLTPLRAKIEREREGGVTHLLLVQRAGEQIVHAALVPLNAVIPIWTEQRDLSQRLIGAGLLGRRKKNHAMNGSSPTLWLRDTEAEDVPRALWAYPGVEDIAAWPLKVPAVDDTFDDLPSLDLASLGRDAATRIERVVSGVPRSPQVRAEVVLRSKGACERPGCGASRDYPGFLDVHHILGVETSDRVWNCVALCPNCHREAHVSPERERINAELLAHASQWR